MTSEWTWEFSSKVKSIFNGSAINHHSLAPIVTCYTGCAFDSRPKVIYPKYSKHYTVAHTIDCVCSKMLNHGLNQGLFLLGAKSIKNSGLKSRLLYILFFLDVCTS